MSCPCGVGSDKESCCAAIHRGERPAKTAEELMRSRYAAFVLGEVDYIISSHHAKGREEVDRDGVLEWSKEAEWQGLEIVNTEKGGPDDDKGFVEFIARYQLKGEDCVHHEHAHFLKEDGIWFFEDGHPMKTKPVVRDKPKVGRNEPCPCGSGKKHKRCCG